MRHNRRKSSNQCLEEHAVGVCMRTDPRVMEGAIPLINVDIHCASRQHYGIGWAHSKVETVCRTTGRRLWFIKDGGLA